MTLESLASDLGQHFRNQEDFSIKIEQLPFKIRCVALRWGTWLVRVHYNEGARAAEGSAEISEIVGSPELAGISRQIRAVFSSDDAREYTNEAIYMMQFLQGIPGAILYDPQQRNLIK